MATFFVIILVTLLISFTCSLLEAVILSVQPAFISVSKKKGNRSGHILSRLKANINRPLIAILTLNTLANTGGAAGIGAHALKLFGDQYLAAASAILTLVILVFSEVIPKSLGAMNWKALAPTAAYLIHGMVIILFPIVFLLEKLVSIFRGKKPMVTSRAEIIETAEIGATEGSLRRNESVVIKNMLLLGKVLVADILTPREEVMAISADYTVDHVMKEQSLLRFTRTPVFLGDLDNIVGVVHRFRIMEAASRDHDTTLIRELMTSVEFVHEDLSVAQVLDQFILKNRHLFIVLDDQNKMLGIVTLEDAIETLLGVEIVDEMDSIAAMRRYAQEIHKKRQDQIKQGAD